MGFFSRLREKQAASWAWDGHRHGDWGDLEARLSQTSTGVRAGAWAHCAVRYANTGNDQFAVRALRQAVCLDPARADAWLLLANLENEAGHVDEAIEGYTKVLELRPRAIGAAMKLAHLRLADGDFDEAIRLITPFMAAELIELRLLMARALFALGRNQEVVDLLEPLARRLRVEMSLIPSREAHSQLVTQQREVSTLYGEAFAALHGRERVIESPFHAGDLDPRAGVNFQLMGEARMAQQPAWQPDTKLRSVDDSVGFGERLIEAGERSRGLCHVGAAYLRSGDLDRARKQFEAARDEDDENFAAYLGLGAVLDYDSRHCFDRVAGLRLRPDPVPGLTDIVLDWPALTDDERRAVTAAALPLARLLPRVAERGGRARILPIDARPVDLDHFAGAAGQREEWDNRCLDAITGVASEQLCVAKIERLLDIGSQGHWVFAHELAHLVHFHAPEDLQARIEELYARLCAEQHLLTVYETKNSAEFVAVCYVDYLDRYWGLPTTRERDEEGMLDQAFALFEDLG